MASRSLIPPKAASSSRRLHSFQIGISLFGHGSGGLDRMFSELVQALPAAGIDVAGAVVGPDNVAASTEGRIHNYSSPGAWLPARLLGARRSISGVIRGGEFDLIAAHFALFAAAAIDKLNRLPLVVHFHGPWAAESIEEGEHWVPAKVKYLIESAIYRRADRIIVLSKSFGQILSASYGIPLERIRIVHGCVNITRFKMEMPRAAARHRLGWPTDRPILLSIRRLANRMGIDRLLLAMAIVVRSVPEVLLYIAGDGYLKGKLQRQAADLGLERNVHFLGFISEEELPLVFRAADINVVPTLTLEGFGLTAAEGLAAGTPAMVTPIGGLPEVVSDLSSNLVFRSTEVAAIAEGLIGALRGTLRLPDASACARFAAGRFAPEVVASRIAATYREVV